MYTCRTLLARYSLLTRRGAATLSPLAVTIRFTPMVPKGHIVIRRGGRGGRDWDGNANAMRCSEFGPKGLHEPKEVSSENEEWSMVFEP